MTKATEGAPAGAKVTMEGDRELLVERIFSAPRDRVWEAMTTPALLSQWWGRGNRLVVERYELERGGHWRFVEHAGGQEHGFEGRFGEIVAPESVVQTFEWDGMPAYPCRETMRLEDLGDGRTRLHVRATFFTAQERDGMVQSGMEDGMNQSYAALDRVLEGMV